MPADITGIVAPVLTPFDDDGELQPEHIADSVEFTLECGCHGVVASGTGVQETAALSPEERKTVITETIDAVDGDVPVLAGVSYPAQPVVTELVEHAESEGADALLAMPPWGVEPSSDAIIRYYTDIDAVTDLPILMYNNPSVTVDMSKETMVRIAKEVDGVEYVKESSRDWAKLAYLFETVHHAGHADVLATMDVLLPTLQVVDTGVIVPAPISKPSMDVYEAFQDGELERAIEIQRAFGDFPPAAADVGLTPVCKAGTEIAGVPVGSPRAPYGSLSQEGRDAVEAWMDEVGVPRMD
ncbi:dihydrodipicolinate synthase family protein [Natronosalvus halobius]|uniref:dihydrodipicolinate synthase family protein n=1 Tax=Natronosalvus halobius TaxID=2953746 RepID=UPI00209D85F4|nr:dihydrodipicolinate synthase family protein [Natronosalvus halobius]USZ73596.1 dihydrodipicolinate synthase family protein [Natronosalvus halobius]